jgi:hypothetical protein
MFVFSCITFHRQCAHYRVRNLYKLNLANHNRHFHLIHHYLRSNWYWPMTIDFVLSRYLHKKAMDLQ